MIRNIVFLILILVLGLCSCKGGEEKTAEDLAEGITEFAETLVEAKSGKPAMSTEERVSASMHTIQIALERFASSGSDSRDRQAPRSPGVYPGEISEMLGTDVLKEYPQNAYTGLPVSVIEFGSEPYAGECTYIPVEEDGTVYGFYLFCYGDADYEGIDVDGDGNDDHVILVVKSGNKLPPLEDLL